MQIINIHHKCGGKGGTNRRILEHCTIYISWTTTEIDVPVLGATAAGLRGA